MEKTRKEAKDMMKQYELGELYPTGEGDIVTEQFPLPGDTIEKGSDLILYFN